VNRLAAIIVVAVALILAAIGVWHVGQPSAGRKAHIADTTSREKAVSRVPSASVPIGSTGNSNEAPPSADAPPIVSSEMIARDAEAAAEAWRAKAQRVIEAKNVKEFGAGNAALLHLPVDEAWKALQARAKSGDKAALVLMNYLSSLCVQGETYRRTPLKPGYLAGLPEGWALFIDRLHEMQADAYEARVSHCDGIGQDSLRDFLLDHIDRLLRADDPEVKLGIVSDNPDDTQAIADLRELARESPSRQVDDALGSRLLRSADTSQQAEGRAILERLAPDDPIVAIELAYCLTEGCDHFAANPPAAMPWIEIAAGLGEQAGFFMMAKALDASNDAASAWAWSNYALGLALAGCFEAGVPTYVYVVNAAVDESRRRHSLNATQHNAGLAEYYAISGRWQRKAMEHLSCGE
jgi:hypothetical protein